MKEGERYAAGLQLNFFESADFETLPKSKSKPKPKPKSKPESESSSHYDIIGRNVLRLLMMGWRANWSDILSWQMYKAIFIERDHQLTKSMRLAFQQGFEHIYSQLKDKTLTDLQHNQALLFISNCMTILPYSDMTTYESFAIPQWLDGSWQMVDYKVVPIELTPTSGFRKLFLSDDDRVFAYGLEPITNAHAQPHLIFMGTTYPAGQGFSTQVNTDLESFETAGKKLYRSGQTNIEKWMDKQDKKIHVCGTSLGGALSLLLAIDKGEKLSRVDALNPPGLYNPWRKSRFDHWDELKHKPDVYIQRQADDPVSMFGIWKEDWHLLKVTPPASKKGPNGLTDHALNYAGFAETEVTSIDIKKDNDERWLRNFWLYAVARSLFYFLVLVPFRYTFLPLVRYIITHKLQLAIMASLTVFFTMFPLLAAALVIPILGPTMSAAFSAALSAVISGFLLNNLLWAVSDLMTGKTESDVTAVVKWIASLSVLGKSFLGGGALIIMAAIAAAFFLPALAPFLTVTSLFFVAAIPVVLKLVAQFVDIVKTLTGFNDVTKAVCHLPDLPRNQRLDIYQNSAKASFTLREIGDYYIAKRCLLKGKNLLPEGAKKGSVTFNGESKYDVLKKIEAKMEDSSEWVVEGSKAKIHNMKQTVQLVNKFGLHRDNKALLQGLKEIHSDYSAGKVALHSQTK